MERDDPSPQRIHGLPLQFRNNAPPIMLCYCSLHDQTILQAGTEFNIYMTAPSADESFPFSFIFKFILTIVFTVFVTSIYNNIPTPPTSTLPPLLISAPHTTLRTQPFGPQHSQIVHAIGPTFQFAQFDKSILSHVLRHLENALTTLKPEPKCLCHHHLHQNYSIKQQYAAVCMIQLGPLHYQPLINPKALSLDHLLSKINYSRRSAIKETSWILPNTTRWRHNALAIASVWPNFETTDATQQQRIETIVFHGIAHCMALALDEIEALQG